MSRTDAESTSSGRGLLWRDRILLLLIGLTIFGAGLGARDPWPADEPRYALVGKQMAEGSDWLFPRRAGEIYSDKPPVFFWCIALFYRLTGSIRVAFLLPSLLAGLLTLLLVHDLARRLWNRRVALYAGLTMLSVLQFVIQARAGQIDALVTFWTTLAVYGLIRHLLVSPNLFWWYVAFASMGAGIITKGVGFLPLLLLIPFLIASRYRWRNLSGASLSLLHLGGGILVMLGVIGLWVVPMAVAVERSGDPTLVAYRDDILLRQTGGRYAHPWHHFHWPGYYLAQVIPWAWLPLSFLLPWAIPAWRRRLRRRDARLIMLLGWVVLVIVFFSASPGKRGVYLLPALPAFCLAFAPLMPGLIRLRRVQLMARTATVIVSIVIGIAAVLLVANKISMKEPVFANAGDIRVVAFAIGASAIAGLALAFLPLRRAPLAFPGLIWGLFIVSGWVVLPRMNEALSSRKFMRKVTRLTRGDAELGILAWKEQFVLQSNRPIQTFGYGRGDFEPEALEGAQWLTTGRNRALLVTDEHVAFCFDETAAIWLDRQSRRNWYLVRQDAIKPECRPVISR